MGEEPCYQDKTKVMKEIQKSIQKRKLLARNGKKRRNVPGDHFNVRGR